MKTVLRMLLPLLLVCLLLALTACGGNNTPTGSSEPSAEGTGASTEATEAVTMYSVTYEGGEGAVGSAPMARDDLLPDETVALATNPFIKDGYEFTGWSDGVEVYQPGDFYKVNADVTFTAQWMQSKVGTWICDGEEAGSWAPPSWHFMDVVRTGAMQGSAYLQATSAQDIVIENWTADLNMEPYMESGSLHMWLYVDNASAVTGGQLEFTSSGMPDLEELHFGQFGVDIPLHDGWNELTLPLSDLQPQNPGETCYTDSISCIRFYINHTGTITVGIDDMYLTK